MTETPVVVVRTPSYRLWELGSFRAAVWQVVGRKWRWRVLAPAGPGLLAGGVSTGVRRASASALAALVEHAT